MAGRQRESSELAKPMAAMAPAIMGMTAWVTPPPRLPQPAVVALATPTTFDENMTDVWYCVMTKEAPITPMARREMKYEV
jgi:hypothetical protein